MDMSIVQEETESFSKELLGESLAWLESKPSPVIKTEVMEKTEEVPEDIAQVWIKQEYELPIKEVINTVIKEEEQWENQQYKPSLEQGIEDEKVAFSFKSEELIIDDVQAVKDEQDPLAFETEGPISNQMEEDGSDASDSTNNKLAFSCEKSDVSYSSPLHSRSHKKFCRGPKKSAVIVTPEEVTIVVKVVNDKGMYCCKWCNYQTKYCWSLKNHLVTHTGAKPHQCEVCDKTFTLAGNLATHKRIHTQEKPYKCSECEYACNQANSLKTHMARHTGEKVLACKLCEYKTADSSHLTKHMRTHTQEKPFSCTHCQYKATSSSNLQSHIRAKHTNEKPYSCTHCDYKTTRSSTLKTHILRMHTADKPFSCALCEYKTTVKSDLTQHMKRKHSA